MNDIPKHITGTGIRSILRNAIFLLGGRWLNAAVRFIYVLLLTRYLSPGRYGLLNFGMAWYITFMALAGLGMDVLIGRGVGKATESGRKIVSQTFGIRVWACIAVALLSSMAALVTEPEPEIRRLLYVFSLALIGRSMSVWTDGVFIAHEKAIYSLKLHAVFRPLEVVLGIIVMASGGDILSLAAIQTASWWLQAGVGIYLLKKLRIDLERLAPFKVLVQILRQGAPVMIGNIMTAWMLQGPVVMYRHLSGDTYSLGQFALSMQIFIVVSHMPVVINSAALPVLSRSVERRDGKDLVYLNTMIRLSIVLGTLATICAFSIGPQIVEIIFGQNYQAAGRLIGPVSILLAPWTIGGSIARTAYAKGRFIEPTVCAATGAVTLVVGMSVLADGVGAQGAVIAAAAGMSVWALGMIAWFTRSYGLDLKQAIITPLTLSILTGAVYLILIPYNKMTALGICCLILIGYCVRTGMVKKSD